MSVNVSLLLRRITFLPICVLKTIFSVSQLPGYRHEQDVGLHFVFVNVSLLFKGISFLLSVEGQCFRIWGIWGIIFCHFLFLGGGGWAIPFSSEPRSVNK